jgi:hypothetical protein
MEEPQPGMSCLLAIHRRITLSSSRCRHVPLDRQSLPKSPLGRRRYFYGRDVYSPGGD